VSAKDELVVARSALIGCVNACSVGTDLEQLSAMSTEELADLTVYIVRIQMNELLNLDQLHRQLQSLLK
jgi:hypothetical protein